MICAKHELKVDHHFSSLGTQLGTFKVLLRQSILCLDAFVATSELINMFTSLNSL